MVAWGMVPSLRVCFPSTQVRAGEIGTPQLGRAYLAALAAALFLLACLRLLRGDEAGAGPLLRRLRAVGPGLRFSHGVTGRFSAQGRLLGIALRERLDPPAPFGQVGRALREV